MRAAAIRRWGEPLELEELPRPEPGPGEVLVRIRASGVCHTDLHLWRGDWPGARRAMERRGIRVLGHEGVGEVEELGPHVERLKKGDRVGIPWMNYWCGLCEYCSMGAPQWCEELRETSLHVNGTYAEYAVVSERGALRIPAFLGEEQAAGLLCGGLTAYGAVRKLVAEARLPPGKGVAVIGAAGGLGHYAVQVAKAFGYRVIGIDRGAERVRFVEGLGADVALDAMEGLEALRRRTGDVHAALVFTPSIEGYALSLRLIRNAGTLVVVGSPPEEEGTLPASPDFLLSRGLRILPSVVGLPHEFAELLALVEQGKVSSHVGRVAPLQEVNAVLGELLENRYLGRAVLRI